MTRDQIEAQGSHRRENCPFKDWRGMTVRLASRTAILAPRLRF